MLTVVPYLELQELATFDWKEGSGSGEKWTSVSLTDNRTGAKFFSANMTGQ